MERDRAGIVKLFLKNLLFTVLIPGTVAVYVPLLIVNGSRIASHPWLKGIGILIIVLGAGIYAWTVLDFANFGRGTPFPVDAPKKLVVRGLYQYVRNPMYLGVILVILGWAAVFVSGWLLLYASGVTIIVHLFVVGYEEPRLKQLFGVDYEEYRKAVGRWVPLIHGNGVVKMKPNVIKKDKHFPVFTLDNFIRRLFDRPDKHNHLLEKGQVVADLGCGPGYFTFSMADSVGLNGRVFAIDSDEKSIRAVEKKAVRKGYQNVEAHVASSARLGFIDDGSVDFILADGLLCCVAPQDHPATVGEIKRILKTDGKAFLLTARGSISYVDDREWESILGEFIVEERNYAPYKGDRWAIVKRRI